MRNYIASAFLATYLGLFAHCVPSAENLMKLLQHDARTLTAEQFHEGLLQVRDKRLIFDPLTTPIDVSGEHAFQPPNFENGDQRSPCPGINALANHGYVSRDGVVGLFEIIEPVNTVLGMGIDIVTLLAVISTVWFGNPISLTPGFSFGGESVEVKNILGNLGGLLVPQGLDGSHNFIEADSSNTRDDLYVTGDANTMNMTLFMEIHDFVAKKGHMTMDDIADRNAKRFDESVATNPYFYYGPYTGLIPHNGQYLFSGRLLSNHSSEYPLGGHLTLDVLESFWGVSRSSDGELVYNRGWERIPENWYRIAADYTLVSLNLDLVDWIMRHPKLASVGGNLGAVNTFAGVNLEDITGGALNAVSLLEGNNVVCFALNILKTFAPNSLASLFETLEKPLRLVNDAVLDPLLDLDCPAFDALTEGGTDLMQRLLETYPGAKKSGFAF